MRDFFELPEELLFEKIFSYSSFSEQARFSMVSRFFYENIQLKNNLLREAALLTNYLFYSGIFGSFRLPGDFIAQRELLIDWLKVNPYDNKISDFIQQFPETFDNEKQVALLQACNNQEEKCRFSNNIGKFLKALSDTPAYIKEGDFIIFELVSLEDEAVPDLFKTLCNTYPNSNWKYEESCSSHEGIKSSNIALFERLFIPMTVFAGMIQCNTTSLFDHILKRQPNFINQFIHSSYISLLHIAIGGANPEMLEYFITNNADIHKDHGPCIYPGNVSEPLKFNQNQKTYCPLFLSIALLLETQNENQIGKLGKITSILLKNGANPFQKAINWFYDAELESCPEYETVEYCKKALAEAPICKEKEDILKSVIAHAELLNTNRTGIVFG